MNEDVVKGKVKGLAGQVEGAVGDLTSNPELESEGLLHQVEGAAQEAFGQAKDAVAEAARASSAALADAFEAGANYYDSSNQAVRRQIGDNTLAVLFVAGAVGYGLAWLIHSRR